MKKFILVLITLTLGIIVYELKNPEERFEKVASKCVPTTVSIQLTYDIPEIFTGEMRKVTISGAGVFITPEGHILTCAHLFNLPFKRDRIATVSTYDGSILAGDIVAISEKHDLALVKINPLIDVKYTKLADPRKLKVGQEVVAIGNPFGLDFTVTHGIISALNRDVDDQYNLTQSDAFINPGNSGGPLFNIKGELVGINSCLISGDPLFPSFSGLGFSVQAGQCLEFLVYHGQTINPHRRYKWLRLLVYLKRLNYQK